MRVVKRSFAVLCTIVIELQAARPVSTERVDTPDTSVHLSNRLLMAKHGWMTYCHVQFARYLPA